jgi:acyl-CoA synthetase (AMP-forming)/AMP-acid ligase II
MSNLSARLEHHAQTKSDAVFCTFLQGASAQPITFAHLFERAKAYARRYERLGVRPGDLVIIILQHSPHLFYSYLGAILAGAVPSFMPFPSPKQHSEIYWHEHEILFERIRPRLIVTYSENLQSARAALPGFSIPVLLADDSAIEEVLDGAVLGGFSAAADSIACLQHSSGTTGLKKGVMLTHEAIVREVDVYAKAIGFTEDDSIASWLPLYHDMGFIGCFMTSVVLGTHLVALDPFEWVMRPTLLLDAIERYGTTFAWLPNFAFSHIVNGARRGSVWNLSSLRALVNCSEPCKASTFERFLARFASSGISAEHLQVCYAMAENVFAVSQTRMGEAVAILDAAGMRVLSCGVPVEGVEIQIRAADGTALSENAVGEICLRSPFMFNGYYKLPEKTAQRVREGWYHTGDMGLLHDGELYVTGRIDDMLIINGRNYYAHEIEAIVNDVAGTLPGRNVAIGVEDTRTDATVVVILAECARDADDAVTSLEIKRLVLETLGLAVHSVVILDSGELIKTTSGKISRSKNKELYQRGSLVHRGSYVG